MIPPIADRSLWQIELKTLSNDESSKVTRPAIPVNAWTKLAFPALPTMANGIRPASLQLVIGSGRAIWRADRIWPAFDARGYLNEGPAMKAGLMTVLLCFASLARLLANQDNEQAKAEVAMMQGEWSMVSGSADGQQLPEELLKVAKRVCKGNETTVTIGPQLIMQATFTIDPSKTPKAIDYQVTDGPTKGKRHLGIYEFEGESIRYCFAAPDDERPAEFTSNAGQRRTLSVWKRPNP